MREHAEEHFFNNYTQPPPNEHEHQYDYDRRCKLDKQNKWNAMQKFLDDTDANNDGFISKEELRTALKAAAERHRQAQERQKATCKIVGPVCLLISGVCGFIVYRRIRST